MEQLEKKPSEEILKAIETVCKFHPKSFTGYHDKKIYFFCDRKIHLSFSDTVAGLEEVKDYMQAYVKVPKFIFFKEKKSVLNAALKPDILATVYRDGTWEDYVLEKLLPKAEKKVKKEKEENLIEEDEHFASCTDKINKVFE
jgi:hypothetical protein